MAPDEVEGWILKIGLALIAIAGGVWGIVERMSKWKLAAEAKKKALGAEEAARIKMDSAEAAKMRAEAEKLKEKERAEHYERIIKRTESQLDKLDKRLDEATEEVEKMRKEHTTCREELATERERGRNQDKVISQLQLRVTALENQIARSEKEHGPAT